MPPNKIKCFDSRGNEWEFFENEFIDRNSVYAVIIKDNKILLTLGVWTNLWGLPGGGKDEGESDFEALSREVLEETGLVISKEITYIEKDINYFVLSKVPRKNFGKYYLAEIIGGKLIEGSNNDDSQECKYIPLNELYKYGLAIFQKEIIRKFSDKIKL